MTGDQSEGNVVFGSGSDNLTAWVNRQTDEQLRIHDMHLFAESLGARDGNQWRTERQASVTQIAVSTLLLRRVRELIDGPILLLKGLEIAHLYPQTSDRSFGDLDLLVPNADEAQARLIAAGARPLATTSHVDPDTKQHLPPVRFDDLPIPIEVHRKLGALSWTRQPASTILINRRIPAAVGIDGVDTLDPVDHALFLIDHSWRHQPFHRMRDLLDIALAAELAGPEATARRAAEWRLDGVANQLENAWQTLLSDAPPTLAYRLFGQHLAKTGTSSHRKRISADLLSRYFVTSAPAATGSLYTDLRNRLKGDEPFAQKVQRVARTAGQTPAGQRTSDHQR